MHRNGDIRKRANPDQWDEGVKRKRISSFIRQESPPEVPADSEPLKKPALMSAIVTKAPAAKPLKVVTENQGKDCPGLLRNKRMFGMILGTLQKFQSEESRRSSATQRREEIEKKLDQEAEQEKANVKKERSELFRELRDKQATERKLQQKIERVESHEQWEKSQAPLSSFIQTKAKPCIFYLPKKMTPESEKRLKDTKDKYRMIIAEKRAKVQKDLNDIEELYQKEVQSIDSDQIAAPSDIVNQSAATASPETDGNDQTQAEPDENTVTENHNADEATTTGHNDPGGNTDELQQQQQNQEADQKTADAAATLSPDVTGNREFEPNYDE